MENRIDILNELKELSPFIAGMEKVNVFTVPEGYFENLSADILIGIAGEKSIHIDSISNPATGDVPQGYFDNLADTILSKIKVMETENASDELKAFSPMLYSIQNENVFEVPKGYFERLSDQVLNRVQPQHQKVIVMRKRSIALFKYAIAAAFTGIMVLSVFKFTVGKKGSIDPVIAQGTQIASENKFEEVLAGINDADIVKYLMANGSDVDAALVAGSVDENELPSQEDYLIDEKALDKYLNSINVNSLKN